MSNLTLEDLQPFVNKEAVVHIKRDDGSLSEVTGTIKVATVAGIALKVKGGSKLELIESVGLIEEISLAPTKQKSVVQKKLKPIELGQARQHLVDRHGVELQWAKDADEKAAFDYHAGIDHSILGHVHVDKTKDEREEALAED